MNIQITDLPFINANLNFFATVCIVVAFVGVGKQNIAIHKTFMGLALLASIIFMISYLTYHFNIPVEKKFPKDNPFRPLYLTILISHIFLAVPMAPLVFSAVFFALRNKLDIHKKIVKWALPIWLYVSVTGVLIYIFLYKF